MLVQAWNAIPTDLKPELRVGAVGGGRLAQLAAAALQGVSDRLPPAVLATRLDLGRDMLCAAWEHDPLDGGLASQLLALHAKLPWLAPTLARILRAVARHWRKPEDLRYLERLTAQRDYDGCQRYLDAQLTREPENLFWRQQALSIAAIRGDAAWPGRPWPERLPQPLQDLLDADALFLAGDYQAAAKRYAQAAAAGLGLAAERQAQALLRSGQPPQTLAPLWRAQLTAQPWNTNLCLRVYDLLSTGELTSTPSETDFADALLYTYNKAEFLGPTLEALAQSRGWRRIVVLDNGSTDQTPDLLQTWRDRLGAERFSLVTLPVNIGAPAARNWLCQLPELADAPYIAFLDDDALVPPDWLERLRHSRRLYPDAAVWGCRVLDSHAPARIQAADYQLAPDSLQAAGREPAQALADWAAASDLARAYGQPFRLSDLHEQVADFGQFDYIRPCVSTTGCCHLFETRRLKDGGGFNLQFAPTQYDDVERDLRQALKGRFACYQGFLAVRHNKRSGAASRVDRASFGVWLANRYKLFRLFDQEQIETLRREQNARLEQDLLRKLVALDALLFRPADDPASRYGSATLF